MVAAANNQSDLFIQRRISARDLDDGGFRPSKDFRLVHLFDVGWRRAERSRRCRPNDIPELVMAFGKPRREETNLVVVSLHMIESATLPPVPPASLRLGRPLLSSKRCRGRRKPRFHRLNTRRQRIGHGDET